jgi:photosystem II stability/assembly factor-like uncharacterized protein
LQTWATDDGFESLKPLGGGKLERKMCNWVKTTDLFDTGDEDENANRILCIVRGKFGSTKSTENQLLYSDNYFDDAEEATMSDGRAVSGMANMAAVKKWIVVAAKGEGSDELALYATQDTHKWHKAEFTDHKIEEDAYTILESTNYSIQVDVQTAKWTPMGNLFTSNSNGTYFTKNIEHTNRNMDGFVDFEKMSNVQGVVIVNVVDNHKDVLKGTARYKNLKSKISFDDGRTFESLKGPDDEELHLHSVTQLRNSGRVFTSPAPGLVLGVGNTGKMLDAYTKGDLYVSDDGGVTWKKALDDAHKYEFGDQGAVLVAVKDEGPTNEIRYSLNHGKDWGKIETENKFLPGELTTIPDSTSLRFILLAVEGKNQFVSYAINFDSMHERKCEKDDFETWHAREDEEGKPQCIMGRKQSYRRRKADADCFVDEEFKDPEPIWETCACQARDYECDFEFVPEGEGNDKKCVPAKGLTIPEGKCKNEDDTFKGPSGWRLIPGNECDKKAKDAVVKDEETEWSCKDAKSPSAPSGKISHVVHQFPASQFAEWYYMERGPKSKGDDETVIMRTSEREVWVTRDHGKTWEVPEKLKKERIVAIYPHQYYNDAAFFMTAKKKVFSTYSRMDSISDFEAPLPPSHSSQILNFHPSTNNKDWLLWTGEKDDKFEEAYVSMKGGMDGSWEPLLPAIKKCQFIWRDGDHQVDEKLIYCEQHEGENPKSNLQLVSSKDFFQTKDVVFDNVVSFATMSEFIVIASKTEDGKWLKLDASIDGTTFADAKFPPKFDVPHQQAYTVLDSSTHSIFLHVTVNGRTDQEYGSIIKSNSNGTSYVMSVRYVNRNTAGYVDFEKMQGLEGVAIINVVDNPDEVDQGELKKLKTKMTHDDGAAWDLLKAPEKDSEDKPIGCDVNDKDKCSLHLHGYTERTDPRNTFSSPTAVGIMMGVGNVGSHLARADKGNTFLTNDGGITWKEIKKGIYLWEFGDQGSVIVIVQRHVETKVIYYSLDEGDTWTQYEFSSTTMLIDQITTVPSDTSLNFLLWGKDSAHPDKVATVNLDFTGMFDRQCELKDDDPLGGDYELWTPQHPMEDTKCLFGHVAKYHRKRKESQNCYNGQRIDHLHDREDCECTRRDFEW